MASIELGRLALWLAVKPNNILCLRFVLLLRIEWLIDEFADLIERVVDTFIVKLFAYINLGEV